MSDELEIIQKIKRLCRLRRYEDAISLTDRIEIPEFSLRALLLCIESEKSWAESKNKLTE